MNHMNKAPSLVCTALVLLLIIGCKFSTLCMPIANKEPKRDIWITVFVHGIMSIKPHISWSNFMRFLKDEVEGTLYEKTVELMRDDPFFYKNQAMQQIGLHKIDPTLKKENSSASLAYVFEEVSKYYGTQSSTHYYTYGWSGLLSAKARYKDSCNLFKDLEHEVNNLKQQGYNPHIRLIGYSHGGTVCLHLANALHKEFPHSALSIDELILLGTPIISETDYLINNPMFKKIFNVYSMSDRIQICDFFAPNQICSDRLFKSRKGFDLPDKLVQIQLKVTRCKKNVLDCERKFELSKDYSNPTVVYGKNKLLRDISPGHLELWFFGWTPIHYRPHYPLNPLPTASFLPVIIHHAQHIAESINPERSIVADIRPQHKTILFRPLYEAQVHSTVPYLSDEKLMLLRESILATKPDVYSDDIYRAHIYDASQSAQHILETQQQTKLYLMQPNPKS